MKIEFNIDVSDLETMNKENLLCFIHTQLLAQPLVDLCDEICKPEDDYPHPAWKEPSIKHAKDEVEVGRRLVKSMRVSDE